MGKLAEAMDCLGVESYAILYGEDEKGAPLGELSPLGRNRLMGKKGGKKFDLLEESSSGDWGSSVDLEAPKAEESAAKSQAVLAGDGGWAVRGAVVWNAGARRWRGGGGRDWSVG